MAVTITTDPGNPNTIRVTLDAGDTTDYILCGREAVITGYPGGGGTIRAEATWSRLSEVQAGTARWQDWDAGAATAKNCQLLLNATAVRFIAVAQPAVAEVAR